MSLLDMLEGALSPMAEAFRGPLRLLFLIAFDRLKAAEVGNPVIHHLVVLRHAVLLALAEDLNPLVLGGAALTHDLAAVEKVRTADVAAQTDPVAARRLDAHRVQCRILHMREGAAGGQRMMAYVNQVAGNELFSPDVAERVFSMNSVHDDPTIDRPLPDEPDYHAFRAADRLWQLAEGFAVDMERDRRHPKYAHLGTRDLAANRLADIQRSYAKERRLYPVDAPRFFGETMFRSGTAFDLYSRLVRGRMAEYGL
jgi:hypothetical protein